MGRTSSWRVFVAPNNVLALEGAKVRFIFIFVIVERKDEVSMSRHLSCDYTTQEVLGNMCARTTGYKV